MNNETMTRALARLDALDAVERAATWYNWTVKRCPGGRWFRPPDVAHRR